MANGSVPLYWRAVPGLASVDEELAGHLDDETARVTDERLRSELIAVEHAAILEDAGSLTPTPHNGVVVASTFYLDRSLEHPPGVLVQSALRCFAWFLASPCAPWRRCGAGHPADDHPLEWLAQCDPRLDDLGIRELGLFDHVAHAGCRQGEAEGVLLPSSALRCYPLLVLASVLCSTVVAQVPIRRRVVVAAHVGGFSERFALAVLSLPPEFVVLSLQMGLAHSGTTPRTVGGRDSTAVAVTIAHDHLSD